MGNIRNRTASALICAVLCAVFLTGCDLFKKEKDNKSQMLMMLALMSGSGSAIKPDSEHTGSDCSCGVKTSEGSTMSVQSASSAAPLQSKDYVPGEVLVKFKAGTGQAAAERIMKAMGAESTKTLLTAKKGSQSLLKKVKLKSDASVEREVARYKALPEVEYAEPNYIYHAMATPNDPNYNLLWGLHNTGQSVNGVTGTPGIDIDAPEAWNTRTDCSDVIVAVLDTGINYNHRDLAGNMWNGNSNHGDDFIDNDGDPMDMNGHGTHCAGTIGAYGNDGIGIAGVCWRAQLMAVRVLDTTGSGTLDAIAQGIYFAVDEGAHVLSMSLGGPDGLTMQTAVNYAHSAGVIIVAAAGNEGVDNDVTPSYPASYTNPNIIAVAAVDQNGGLASFSNYGSTSVDVGAPGVNILSTWPGQSVTTTEDLGKWTKGPGWGTGTYTYTGLGDIAMLTNPASFGSAYYENDLDSTAYRTFDLDVYGASTAIASAYLDMDIEYNYDYLSLVYNETGGAPNMSMGSYTGSTGGLAWLGEFDLTPLIENSVSLGFNFYTDGSGTERGVGIWNFTMERLYHNTTACRYLQGTSMATPHVAGVVALTLATFANGSQGPYVQGSDTGTVIDYVINYGTTLPSLVPYTSTGMLVNVNNSVQEAL